jgi:hypothetical protein
VSTVETSITSAGIKDSLRVLNDYDKRLRRQITVEYKSIVSPMTQDARELVPTEAPLSGFNRQWTPSGASSSVLPFTKSPRGRQPRLTYGANQFQSKQGRREYGQWLQWKAGLNAYISGKRPQTIGSYTRNLAAFGIRWQGAASVLFDTSKQARTPQGQQMVAALERKYGPPSRVMWRAYERTSRDIQHELSQLIAKINREANRVIATGKSQGF